MDAGARDERVRVLRVSGHRPAALGGRSSGAAHDLVAGDHRLLYLAWLTGVQAGHIDDDAVEPPCPPGLNELSGTLEAFTDVVWLHADLVAAAAEGSQPLQAVPKPGDELFVAFRDATTGQATYEVGRYLFIPFGGNDAAYVLDFNLASNPLCNYSPHYNCPIPLRENTLPVAIRAGEMTYPARRH